MNEENDIYIDAIFRERMRRKMVLAYLNRAREAGIPDAYMRINATQFQNVLCNKFHSSQEIEAITKNIYTNPNWILSIPFIVIDGGVPETRKKAGCAILFRIISFDKIGYYADCYSLMHKFQTINSTEEITRNDLAENLKSYDTLFLSEIPMGASSSWTHFEVSEFFDEILGYRLDYNKPTIISFSDPISIENESIREKAAKGALDTSKGKYLTFLFNQNKTTSNINMDGTLNKDDGRKVLRIRVKKI